MKKILFIIAGLAILVIGGIYALGSGFLIGQHRGAGDVSQAKLPYVITAFKKAALLDTQKKLKAPQNKQILFGDFHVHTTFSVDAFFVSLPMLQGLGAHPPADACDFARFCSNLDFWSINDHAEGITPANWLDTKRSIQQCDAVSGAADDQDLVSFLGWEWTQIGNKPSNHYGHKNVVMREIAEAKTPTRPIASLPPKGSTIGGLRDLTRQTLLPRALLALRAPAGRRDEYLAFNRFINELAEAPPCPKGLHVRSLPNNCFEATHTPKELFKKLDQWELDSIVIPHGTSWGFYTPPGSSWDKQLIDADTKRETLIEVMSGHGNSEEYRDFRAVRYKNGKPYCPKPTRKYLPSCWRAGEIIRKRCLKEGSKAKICAKRARLTRQSHAENGQAAHLIVSGAKARDWLDSGQCKDCLLPAFNYRPAGSVQYIMSLADLSKGKNKRFYFGFIGSSDNHNAQPGTGYKEYARHDTTEVTGTNLKGSLFDPEAQRKEPKSSPVPFAEASKGVTGFQAAETERQASFFTTGGLVAVHAKARTRNAIWDALEQREVYGTSGDRILLWFDLNNAPNKKRAPMGSIVMMRKSPSFTVRVAGAFKQKPGCPEYSYAALGKEGVKKLCLGECYNPSSNRKKITHVDVIRILPQSRQGEKIGNRIQDPWKRLPCKDKGQGCVVRFSDPQFASLKRDVLYYVRAHQKPSPVVNADNLRCTYDARGKCIKTNICYGDYRTPRKDDCLAKKPEVAWSSPIYVNYRSSQRSR